MGGSEQRYRSVTARDSLSMRTFCRSSNLVVGDAAVCDTAQSVAVEDADDALGQLHHRRRLREGIAAEVDGGALQRVT